VKMSGVLISVVGLIEILKMYLFLGQLCLLQFRWFQCRRIQLISVRSKFAEDATIVGTTCVIIEETRTNHHQTEFRRILAIWLSGSPSRIL